MRSFQFFGAGLLYGLYFAHSALAQTVGFSEAPDALEHASWKNRLLVTCERSLGVEDPIIFGAQYDEAFKDWPGYIARDLILVWVDQNGITSWTPIESTQPNKAATLLIGGHDDDPTGLRGQVGCEKISETSISLIGKDGEVKKVWNNPVSNKDLFAIIDAMPMRQSEMRPQAID